MELLRDWGRDIRIREPYPFLYLIGSPLHISYTDPLRNLINDWDPNVRLEIRYHLHKDY